MPLHSLREFHEHQPALPTLSGLPSTPRQTSLPFEVSGDYFAGSPMQ